MDDYLVTIKMRLTVTDPQSFRERWKQADPRFAERLSRETELSLTLAVQHAVTPPEIPPVTGLAPPGAGMYASVKAEPWREDVDPW